MKRFSAFILILLVFAAARCATGVRPDAAMAATEAGDYTALIEGCGNQLVAGYTYCRISEGQVADASLYFVGPPVECDNKKESCITFKIYFPDGSRPAYGGAIPNGQTRVAVLWKQVLGRETFEVGDGGFWPYTYEIRWLDHEKRERKTVSMGEIRLRVMKKEYIQLQNVTEDQNFVWKWIENGVLVKMTTGARTFVGTKP